MFFFTAESMWFHLDLIKHMTTFCRRLFPVVSYAYSSVPTYPSGVIGYLICSKDKVKSLFEQHTSVSYFTISRYSIQCTVSLCVKCTYAFFTHSKRRVSVLCAGVYTKPTKQSFVERAKGTHGLALLQFGRSQGRVCAAGICQLG